MTAPKKLRLVHLRRTRAERISEAWKIEKASGSYRGCLSLVPFSLCGTAMRPRWLTDEPDEATCQACRQRAAERTIATLSLSRGAP